MVSGGEHTAEKEGTKKDEVRFMSIPKFRRYVLTPVTKHTAQGPIYHLVYCKAASHRLHHCAKVKLEDRVQPGNDTES